jgi:DNA-binding NarL/FixJ family response regulator
VIRVVVVDDQALVRAGFRMILDGEDDIDVVAEAGDGQEAVAVVAEARPDVVLMDVRMPTMDGIEATRRIVAATRAPGDGDGTVRVVMLTTFDLDEYVYEALRAGASGFLLKDTPPEDLAAAVRVVAAGDALLAPSITRRVIEDYARRPSRAPAAAAGADAGAGLAALTEREREVLAQLARGLSNHEIGEALHVSETTVKTHVGRILMKLDLRDRVQAVVLAYESGLVVPGG